MDVTENMHYFSLLPLLLRVSNLCSIVYELTRCTLLQGWESFSNARVNCTHVLLSYQRNHSTSFFLSAVLLLWHCLIAWYVCLHTFVTSTPIKEFLWIACYDWRFPSSFHDSNNKVCHCLRLINEQNLKKNYRLTSLLALSSRLSLFCCISSISNKSLLTPFPLFLNKRRSLQL